MFYIKRLYRFILKSFLPLFLMTFFICLFIVLMQFLWRYVDEMVGNQKVVKAFLQEENNKNGSRNSPKTT